MKSLHWEAGIIIIPTSQMRKLKHRVVKQSARHNTASKWQELTPGTLAPASTLFKPHSLMWWGSISQLSPLSGNNHLTFLEYDEHYFLPLIQEMSFAIPCIVNWPQRWVSEVQSESVEQTLSDPNNSCPHSLRGQRGEGLGMIWAEVSRLTELGVVANGALMSRCRW